MCIYKSCIRSLPTYAHPITHPHPRYIQKQQKLQNSFLRRAFGLEKKYLNIILLHAELGILPYSYYLDLISLRWWEYLTAAKHSPMLLHLFQMRLRQFHLKPDIKHSTLACLRSTLIKYNLHHNWQYASSSIPQTSKATSWNQYITEIVIDKWKQEIVSHATPRNIKHFSFIDKIPTPPTLPYYLRYATHMGEGLRILLRYKINNLVRKNSPCMLCNVTPINISYHIFFKCERTKCTRQSFFHNIIPQYYHNINFNSSSIHDIIINPRSRKSKTTTGISVVIPSSLFLSSSRSFTPSSDIPIPVFLSHINKFFLETWNLFQSVSNILPSV